jgi:hypothetical protein
MIAPVWESLNVPEIVFEALNALSSVLETVSAWFDAITPGAVAWVENALVPMVEWISGTVIDALQWLREGLQKISDWFHENESVFTTFLTNSGEMLGEVWKALEPILNAAWGGLKNAIEAIIDTVGDIIIRSYEELTKLFDIIKKIFEKLNETGVFEALGKIVQGVLDTIVGGFNFVVGILTGDWDKAWEGWKKSIEGSVTVWEGLFDFIDGILDAIGNALWGLVNDVKQKVSNIIQIFKTGKWKDIGRDILDGIKQGLRQKWNDFTSWFSGLFDGLVDSAKRLLGINSPSKVFMEIGGYTMEGLEIGISKQAVYAANTMRDSMNRVVSSASAQSGRIANRTAVSIERNESGSSYDDSAAMAEQNALLREQNRIMEQLLRKETVAVVSPSASLGRVVSRSQQMYAAMAGG